MYNMAIPGDSMSHLTIKLMKICFVVRCDYDAAYNTKKTILGDFTHHLFWLFRHLDALPNLPLALFKSRLLYSAG